MPEISAKSWSRFKTTNFCVEAAIMGGVHEFDFENHCVTVRLPKPEDADRSKEYDEVAEVASMNSTTNETLSFRIRQVDVEITIPELISVPKEALILPPTQREYFSDEEQKVTEALCEQHRSVAKRAFDYWIEIIRWVTDSAIIGQPKMWSNKSGWSTYIQDAKTNHRIWAGALSFSMGFGFEITKEHWQKAEQCLKRKEVLPMHLRFLHDAQHSASNGQYEKSILELAMACEIFIRYSVFDLIPDVVPKEFVEYIEEANINKYTNNFFKKHVPTSLNLNYKKISKDISSLMSRRNSYVHMGYMDGADRDHCSRYTSSVKELFKIKLVQD